MADYQSVLTRAVAKLPDTSSAAARRAIYDRAREAMLTHLRALSPPLPESDITREEIALKQAIALVEAKFDGTETFPAELTTTEPAPSAAGHRDSVEAGTSPRPAQLGQPNNSVSVPSSLAKSAPAAPLLQSSPTAPQSPVLRHLPPAQPPSASSNLSKVVPPADAHASRSLAVALSIVLSLAAAAVVMRQNPQHLAIAPLEQGREISPQPRAKMIQRTQPSTTAGRPTAAAVDEARASQSVAQSGRETPQPAPGAEGSTAAVVDEAQGNQSVAQSGRETPQPAPGAEGSTAPPANEAQGRQSVAQSGRETPQPAAEVDGSAAAPANEAEGSQSAAQSGQETSQPAPKADGSTAPVASEPQGRQSVAQSGQEPSQPEPKADNGTLPDAARAAMVIASQDDPQNQVVILGSTVWSIIPPSSGQPSTVAVKADANIPDLKMRASMTLRKNTDPTLQATHTIDLNFALADGAPITGFKDIAPPQMHEPDTPTSEPLTSNKVKVSDVHFLIALANGEQDAPRNFELMQTRSLFEFPLLLNDDRIAKLAFQKSSEGVAMLAKVFDAWK